MTNSTASLGTLIDQVSASADDPLEQLARAVQTATALSTLGDQLVSHFVDAARTAGISWAQIGQALGGVSKQAAQQRFSPDFSRFTLRAREVMTTTQAVAEQHRHNYMGTEHILIALCEDPESVAAKALARTAGSLERVYEAAVARLGDPSPAQAKPRFTPKAKASLTRAMSQALDLGHNYIGTEHLLLGLILGGAQQDEPSVATEVLTELGVTYQAARDDISEQLAGYRNGGK